MKITIIRHSIRDRGGDQVIHDYACHLVNKGHEVIYWTNEILCSANAAGKFVVHRIPFKGKLGTMWFVLTRRFCVDAVWVDIIVMACCAWVRNRDQVVYLAQDYDVVYYASPLLQNLIKCFYWVGFNIMNIFVVVESESLLQKMRKFNIKSYKLVPVGIDVDYYTRPLQLQVRSRKIYVILLAVYKDYRKGIDIAHKALALLRQIRSQQDWEVWAIGGELDAISGVMIRNFGFVNRQQLKDILSRTDIYLLPSRSEGLSILLLCALACHCVVVGTEASNIVTHEVNGLVSSIEDWENLARNLNRALDDQGLCQRLKENGRKLAESFSLDKSCVQFEAALAGFVKERG